MKIAHRKLTDKIHLLLFENQKEITSTFLRFQEYYESPKFRDSVFSLDEFKTWYVKNSPNGIKTGEFTYYSDWNGFNIPSYVLQPFREGKFVGISEQERQLLDIFKDEKEKFYIIGVHSDLQKHKELLIHEIAHGLFYTSEKYKTEIQEALANFEVEDVKNELRLKAGYHEDVLEDEVHAYSIDSADGLQTKISEDLAGELRKIFQKYYNKI